MNYVLRAAILKLVTRNSQLINIFAAQTTHFFMQLQSEREPSIYTFNFILVCLSSFLFSASFNMLIPELPAYLSSLGGAQYKGLIIALFTLTAGISRPFSGKLTDKIGRVPVMAIGSLVCFVCGFLYPVLTSVAGFLFYDLYTDSLQVLNPPQLLLM